MAQKIHVMHPNRRAGLNLFASPFNLYLVRSALAEVVRQVGRRMEGSKGEVWEGMSPNGDHICSANDLEGTVLIIRYVAEIFPQYGLKVDVGFLTEEISLIPYMANGRKIPFAVNGSVLLLVIDPIDGSKAFDNWKSGGDCSLPRPGSAISIAAVSPALGEIVASALYCFDVGEVFSSVFLGKDKDRAPRYIAFRDDHLLRPFALNFQEEAKIEAKRRVLCSNYNSKALVENARLELALMEKGLKPAFGGLTGSTATDIINVVRGSFCVCLDIRALCGKGGSVPYWYDAAGALPIARGRGLAVIVTDSQGRLLQGGNHEIYTPIAFVVARPELEDLVVEAIRTTVCPAFLGEKAIHAAV